jgi:hypothetical protein
VRGIWFVSLAGVLTCGYLMLQLGAENWTRLALWLLVGLNVYFVYGYVRNTSDHRERHVLQQRALAVFALLMLAVGVFLYAGDSWLDAPALHASDLQPGEVMPDHVPTLWDKWIGFPPMLAHGMAIFVSACAIWNVIGLVRKRPTAA